MSCVNKTKTKGINLKRRNPKWNGIHAQERNYWRFFIDQYTNADVLLVADDDAFLDDPNETFTMDDRLRDGKLVATYRRSHMMNMKGWLTKNSKMPWVPSTTFFLGIKPIGDFMTTQDFPIPIWREMLPDFRDYVGKRLTNEVHVKEPLYADPDTFDKLYKGLIPEVCTHAWSSMSEFNLLMHFAYYSPKWHSRYIWTKAEYGYGERVSPQVMHHKYREGHEMNSSIAPAIYKRHDDEVRRLRALGKHGTFDEKTKKKD